MADELDPTLDDNEEMGRSDEDIRDRVDEDETQVLRRPGPLSEEYWDSGEPR